MLNEAQQLLKHEKNLVRMANASDLETYENFYSIQSNTKAQDLIAKIRAKQEEVKKLTEHNSADEIYRKFVEVIAICSEDHELQRKIEIIAESLSVISPIVEYLNLNENLNDILRDHIQNMENHFLSILGSLRDERDAKIRLIEKNISLKDPWTITIEEKNENILKVEIENKNSEIKKITPSFNTDLKGIENLVNAKDSEIKNTEDEKETEVIKDLALNHNENEQLEK